MSDSESEVTRRLNRALEVVSAMLGARARGPAPAPPTLRDEDVRGRGTVFVTLPGGEGVCFSLTRPRHSDINQGIRESNWDPANTRIFYVTDTGSPLPRGTMARNVEQWALDELQYDIQKHVLCPKMYKYSGHVPVAHSDLPIISSADPMARYLALTRGDVVAIERGAAAGTSTYYRICS